MFIKFIKSLFNRDKTEINEASHKTPQCPKGWDLWSIDMWLDEIRYGAIN